MSLAHAPSIVTSGLVFAYDQTSIRSYKGPAVQNLANSIGISDTGTATGYISTGSTVWESIPGIGPILTYKNTIQNNYTAFTPNSTKCCPSLHYWGNISVTPSTLYTYLILYKCDSGYTSSNYMYRYEYASNGGAYVTEGGVHSNANRVHLGGGWYYAWGTFTTQATTTWLGQCGTFYYRYSNIPDRLSVAKVAIIPGNYAGLHPKHWPGPASTISNTQSIIDLTGNSTITTNSLTYSADGSFSFNGSSNYLDCGNNAVLQQASAITMSAWVKPISTGTLGSIMSKNQNSGYRFSLDSAANALWWYVSGNSVMGGSCPNNVWSHCTVTGDATGLKAYVNGVLVASNVVAFAPSDPTGGNLLVGTYGGAEYFNGAIGTASMYNRALTAAEVKQNFNAIRGRYGV